MATRRRYDVDSVDRALAFHAGNAPLEYHGYTDGKFRLVFTGAPDPQLLELSKREAWLVCHGLATGRRSNDLEIAR